MSRAGLVLWVALAAATSARAESLVLSDDVAKHIEEIRSRNEELREDAFSKMGGSSVASKAFLYCFAGPYVDLGDHAHLAETIEYFHTGRPSSFNRPSEAAGVSWNLRYVLGGKPANFRRELEATHARWALVLFGSNDAQNENERVYLKRLVYLVEQMEEIGVVPVLGSALPRRNTYKNRWIYRFNLITEAVAKHWSLPYIDYHAALSALPRKGLARDGVHPNVLPPGGLKNTCNLTEKGLRYGNNVRNLLTLEMLDALRRTQLANADAHAGTAAGTAAAADAGTAAGTDTDALTDAVTDPFPISILVDKPSLPMATPMPRNCGAPKPNSKHYRVPFELAERTRLRASALDLDGVKSRVLLVRHDEETGSRCVRRRTQTLELDARPGMWDLIVEVPERAAQEGQMLILIARDPRQP